MVFQNYLNTFRDRRIFPIFLVDAVFFGLFLGLFYYFGESIKQRSALFSGFTSAEELQQVLLSSPEQVEIFLTALKSFILFFSVGLTLLLVLLLLSFALSRAWIWNYLLGRKLSKKNYWCWNLLVLALIIPSVIYLFASVVVRGVLNYLFSFLNQGIVIQFLNNIVSIALILAFLIFISLVYCLFTHKYKIWESIGDAFGLIKTQWNKLWKFFLLVLATGIIINLLLAFLPKVSVYFSLHPLAFSLLNTTIFLLFLAWVRVYLVKTIGEAGPKLHQPSHGPEHSAASHN